MGSCVLFTCPCPLYSLGPIPPASMISLSNLVGRFRYWAFHISYQACSSSVNFSPITSWGGSLIARNTSNLSCSCCAHLNSCSQAIQLSQTRKSLRGSRQKLSSTSSPAVPDGSPTVGGSKALAAAHPLLDISYSGRPKLSSSAWLMGATGMASMLTGEKLMEPLGGCWRASLSCSQSCSGYISSSDSGRNNGVGVLAGHILSSTSAVRAHFWLV